MGTASRYVVGVLTATAGLALFGPSLSMAAAAPAKNDNKLTEVPGKSGLYTLSHNDIWLATALVTSDGIILFDPINANAATWFKAEARKRWNKEVRWLINSHGHWDHSQGGEVFDKATVVAHDNFYAENQQEDPKYPRARKPDITFSDHMTITHGGETVELYHFGPDHGSAMVYLYHPRTKAIVTVDLLAHERLPYNDLPHDDVDATIATFKKLEAMDIDVVIPGHGRLGTKGDIRRERGYWELLRASVFAHMVNGKSLDEIKQIVPQQLTAYSGWEMWQQWGQNNIIGMHRHLTQQGVKPIP